MLTVYTLNKIVPLLTEHSMQVCKLTWWHHPCDSSLHLCQNSPIGMNLNYTPVTEFFVHTTKSFHFHPPSLIYWWITSTSPRRYIILTICFHHCDWDLVCFDRISSNKGLLIALVSEQLTDSNIFLLLAVITVITCLCSYSVVAMLGRRVL